MKKYKSRCEATGKYKYGKKGALYKIIEAQHELIKGVGTKKKPVRSYYCHYCKMYHLTSQPQFNVYTGKIGK